MSATASRKRGGRRRGGAAEGGDDERWLLTYADMITLLMALFMVLFSISSVNTSKFESLQRALDDAFSGRILPGGKGITDAGGAEKTTDRAQAVPPIPALKVVGQMPPNAAQSVAKEDEDFEALKRQIDAYAAKHGIADKIETSLRQRGLVIRVLTDKLLFDSAQASVKPPGTALLGRVAQLLGTDTHAISVEGHTDNLPIATARYPSNWELSTARASSVVRALSGAGLPQQRFEAAGYAALHPIDSNSTDAGRTRNRRVEIVLLRQGLGRQKGPVTP
ncbi:MAG TPA: flagellar motor protein MotB [Thermoleophilaceae bacterium]